MKRTAETIKTDEFCIYTNTIKECQNKKYDVNLVLHQHHIIPVNAFNIMQLDYLK